MNKYFAAHYRSAVTTSDVAATSLKAAGVVNYQGATEVGVAYKTGNGAWAYKKATASPFNVTIGSLTAATEYTLATYAKYKGAYVYGPESKATTAAA